MKNKNRHRLLCCLSLLMVLSFLSADLARATAPLPSRPPAADRSNPALAGATNAPGVLPQPTRGRILLAPAIDADDDPATNPLEGEPVPVVQIVRTQAGLVALAAQLLPDDPQASPIHVPVTFRLWRDGELLLERSVEADAWGAASLEAPTAEVDGAFSYQASAPGFGATEVRHFRFDPGQATYNLHGGQARLSQRQTGRGTYVLSLISPVSLQAGRDQATLTLARQPANLGESDLPLMQPVLDQIMADGLALPFPDVPLEIVDARTARLEVQLPPGSYRAVANLTVNGASLHQYLTEPLAFAAEADLPTPPAHDALWVAGLEHEAGQRLVRYTAPPGQAVFALVPTDQAPDLRFEWEAQNTILKSWRTGPFEWVRQRYQVDVQETLPFSLRNLDYDLLLRRYTVDLQRHQAETGTETVQFEVFGPNEQVIYRQSATAAFAPGAVARQAVEVPAHLGKPYGLRVLVGNDVLLAARLVGEDKVVATHSIAADILTAPVQLFVSTMDFLDSRIAQSNTLPGFSGFVQFSLKLYIGVLGAEVVNKTYTLPPGAWADAAVTPWDAWVEQVAKNLLWQFWFDQEVILATGGLVIAVDSGLQYTLDLGECPDPDQVALAEGRLFAFATELDNRLKEHTSEDFLRVKLIPIPIFWVLQLWGQGDLRARAAANAGGPSIQLTARIEIDVSLNVGLSVSLLSFYNTHKTAIQFIGAAVSIVDAWAAFWAVVSAQDGSDVCLEDFDPDPPDRKPPDDRQDVWQDIDSFYKGDTLDETIDNLHTWLAAAQDRGLDRAARLLTLRLREAERERFVLNRDGLNAHANAERQILLDTLDDLGDIISGTVPISPSLTFTDAIAARNEQAIAELAALPYAKELSLHSDNVEIARAQFLALYGQELALQQELRDLFFVDTVGVLASGFAETTLTALAQAGLRRQLVSPWRGDGLFRGKPAPYLAPGLAPRVLVVPSGGLGRVAQSPSAAAWLEEYVAGGGLLIVFTQATGADWEALPGGQVRAVGYNEDQRCEQESVQAGMPSDWLVWMGHPTPDIQVDGAFTAWPPNANLLLLRRSALYAGYPAMIEYPYGAGTVLATTAYGDWATHTAIWWGDDWQMTRSILIRALLLARGQDVADVRATPTDSDVSVSFPLTNTAAYTTTAADVILPVSTYWLPGYSGNVAHVPISLPPQQSGLVSADLHTAPALRGIHNWSQVGLFNLRARVQTENGTQYGLWPQFLHVTTPVVMPEVGLRLSASSVAAQPGETVVATATVHNYSGAPRTVVLRGQGDLPATPLTLTLPVGGEAQPAYSLDMDRSKQLRATLSEPEGPVLQRARLTVYLAEPNLQADPLLPTPFAQGAPIGVEVSNRPRPSSPAATTVNATLALTLTAPSGAPLWTDTQDVPRLVQGQSAELTYTLGDPGPTSLGVYRLAYRFFEGGQPAGAGEWQIPARLTLADDFDRPAYQVRDTVVFTTTLRNTERFDLAPQVTIDVPDLGLSTTQQVPLPVGAEAAIPFSFALPGTLVGKSYPVIVRAEQGGGVISEEFSFSIPPSWITADVSPGPYAAGDTISVTLHNSGGADTTVDYSLKLGDDTGFVVALNAGSQAIEAASSATLPLVVPAQAASGETRLVVGLQDQITGRNVGLTRFVTLDGIAAAVDVPTDQESYAISETIRATGWVTALQGTVSGTLALQATRAEPGELVVGANERVNSNDETGIIEHRDPALALDAAGNAYAVWSDTRDGAWKLYFAQRPAGGAWSAAELVDERANTDDPAIAVDAAGNAHVVWTYTPNLYYARRAPDGTWSTRELVNSVSSNSWTADISVDLSGTAHVVWIDRRENAYGDVYYASRPAGGGWSANVKVNDDGGATTYQYEPAIATDASGNAYAAWRDYRAVSSGEVYFATKPLSGAWSANEKVNTGTSGIKASPLDIAAAADGAVHVVWADNRNEDVYHRARSAAGVWGAEAPIKVAASLQTNPSIALDAAGNAYAVWSDLRSLPMSIYFATLPAGGAWSADEKVSDNGAPLGREYPVIGVDTAGNALAAWADNRANPFGHMDILFATRPVTGTWSADARLSDATGGAGQAYPAVAIAPDNTVYAVWQDTRQGSDQDIYFGYRPASGSWSFNERVNDANADYWQPDVALDPSGAAYAVWEASDSVSAYWDTRPPSGTWGADEQIDNPSARAQDFPQIAAGPAGDTYVIWEECCGATSYDVYFAYRAADGTWSPNEQVHGDTGAGQELEPDIAVDAAGNAYAIWKYWPGSGSTQVLFAIRPAGGSWGPPELVTTSGYRPAIAVDAAGNAYAVFEANLGYGLDIGFAYRPAGGTWSAVERVTDDTNSTTQETPSIAVDEQGTVYAAWKDRRDNASQREVYFAYRPAGGTWSANVRVNEIAGSHNVATLNPPDVAAGTGGRAYVVWPTTDDDIYGAWISTPGTGALLWERNVIVDTAGSQAIDELVGTLDNRPGKYWLEATLRSPISQTLGASRHAFYIFPDDEQLTLETDKAVYRPGETIAVSGRLTNTASATATLTLLVQAGDQTLVDQPYTLGPGQGAPYTATLPAADDVLIQATAGLAVASEAVKVSAPAGQASLSAPQVAGYDPISATVAVTNSGLVDVVVDVTIASAAPETLALEPGQVGFVSRDLSLAGATLLTATVRGDLSLDLDQQVQWGEAGAIALVPPGTELAGAITVGTLASGTGQLPTPASLQIRLDADPPSSESLTLWPGQVVSDSLALDVPPGRHTLTAELYDLQGQLLDSDALELALNPSGETARPEIEILDVTTGSTSRQLASVAAAGSLTVTVTIANHGPEGAVVVGAQLFDAPQQWVITAAGYLTQTFAFSLSIPADLPQGAHTGLVVAGDQSRAFSVDLSGVDLALALALDAATYLPGEPVHLTATITDLGGDGGDYHLSLRYLDAEDLITVTVPAGGALVHTFVFTATEAERASVSLSFLPQPGEAAQRVITIDSLAVNVVDPSPGATLTFDQAVYHPGDVVTLDVSVVGERRSVAVIGPLELSLHMDDPLLWWAPRNEAGQVITGTHTVHVTLPPQMKTGRYTFLLLVEGNEVPYPIDVQGWSVLADRLTLDQVHYNRQDTLSASVEFYNEGAAPIDGLFLYAAILPPDGGSPLPFSPEVSQTVTLQPGLNRLTFSGAFETLAVGAHRMVVDLRPQGETWRLAAASAQFDVGWAQLVELTTDRGNYAPGEPGLGRLDVYGVGPTHLVVTTSVGTTVLDTVLDLDGFEALTFSIPTASEGDYLLSAQSTDRDGNIDHLVGAYAVPPPRDTTPPAVLFTNLAATTFITTTAPTLTLTVEGVATDDSGSATVLLDGRRIEPGVGGAFAAEVEVRQGSNRLWAVAVDEAGNVGYSPEAAVILMPERNFSLGADQAAVGVGDLIVLRVQLSSSGVVSDTRLAFSLPAALVEDVAVSTGGQGQAAVSTLDPDVYGVLWRGDLAANSPAEIVVTAWAIAPGTVPVQATAYWGYSLSDSAQTEVEISVEPPSTFKIYLPLISR